MIGVSGLAGDPAYPPRSPRRRRRSPLGTRRRDDWRAAIEQARLALVAIRQRDHHARSYGRPPACNQSAAPATSAARRAPRPAPTSPTGRGAPRSASNCGRAAGCARSPSTSDGLARGRALLRRATGTPGAVPAGRWSSSPATASARRGCCSTRARASFPDGIANRSGLVGKNLMFHPYALVHGYADEVLDSNRARRCRLWSHAVLRNRSGARLRARLLICSSVAASGQCWRQSTAISKGASPGARVTTCFPQFGRSSRQPCRDLRGSARGAQRGNARSGAEGRAWHSRAKDRLPISDNCMAHAGPRHRAGEARS